jgi:hypothetical protein
MLWLLNNKNYITKEVKKMKRIGILAMAILFSLLLVTTGFCTITTSDPTSTLNRTQLIETWFNAYGVATSGQQTSYSKLLTTSVSTNTDGTKSLSTSTTETISEAYLKFLGGSLKMDYADGSSNTTNSDGAKATTTFGSDYKYSSTGLLSGATGSSESDYWVNGVDFTNGGSHSTSSDAYNIEYGQAIVKASNGTATSYGVGSAAGTAISTTVDTTTYTNALKGGQYCVTKEVAVSTTTDKATFPNSTEHPVETLTKTKTYGRDGNGVCTGITQTGTGSRTVLSDTGGKQSQTLDYTATSSFDTKMGYYTSYEKTYWSSPGDAPTTPTPYYPYYYDYGPIQIGPLIQY